MKKILPFALLMFSGFFLLTGTGFAEEQKAANDYAAQCKEEAAGVADEEAYIKECIKQLEEIAKEASANAEK